MVFFFWGDIMDLEKIYKTRWSVREYDTNVKISDDELKKIFDLVKLTPSAFNLQPWDFLVVRDQENKKKLRAIANNQKQVEDASATIVVIATVKKAVAAKKVFDKYVEDGVWDKEMAERRLENFKEQDNNLNLEERKLWSYRSAVLAAESLMLAAKHFGWDTGPMEGFDFNALQKEYNIPEEYYPVMLITIGKSKISQPDRQYRRPFNDIVHKEEF